MTQQIQSLVVCCFLLAYCFEVDAGTVSRYVKPDGSVIYSDHPISNAVQERVLHFSEPAQQEEGSRAPASSEPSLSTPLAANTLPEMASSGPVDALVELQESGAHPSLWMETNIRALKMALGSAAVVGDNVLHQQLSQWEHSWGSIKACLLGAQEEFQKNASVNSLDQLYRVSRRKLLQKEEEYIKEKIDTTRQQMASSNDENDSLIER